MITSQARVVYQHVPATL